MADAPAFQVSLPGQPGAEDALGLWGSIPAGSPAPAPAAEAGSLWLAYLPDDPDAADALLGEQARRSQALARAIPAAQAQFRADLAGLRSQEPGGLSFALAQAGPDAPLNILAGALQYRYPEQADSFGLLDVFRPARQQVEDSAVLFDRFTRQVRQTIDGFAQIETISGGRRLASTLASWSGDLETWWTAGGLPEERRRHEQVLSQALAARQHWLRFFLLVAGGIPRVAGALAAGPFSPIAIWAAWNYFQKALQAYRRAVQLPEPPANPA
mgnify:CR=1 FL=1